MDFPDEQYVPERKIIYAIVYTGPEPFRRLYDEYAEALRRLKRGCPGYQARITDDQSHNFFLLCFPLDVTSYEYPDTQAIALVEFILDPEKRKEGQFSDEFLGVHPVFDEDRLPTTLASPLSWSDARCDEQFTESSWEYIVEDRKSFMCRRSRRLRYRDMVTYHMDENGFTSATLYDPRTGVTITNEDPRAEFDYDLDAAVIATSSQSGPGA
ncbi:uncharacterized protein LDX57_009778 [Aspergillus melleus]|uniref:uncharacterized protein n=1 Tax=Aspergillus melleus TaxID=138277 RepID=UPI001E8DB616|nr:uncharacterized protein LDX57_009778 [Aspergillus melleus]KAH8432132.1 hypothetical protein LDX57_009778 [Aspergillus melleus]